MIRKPLVVNNGQVQLLQAGDALPDLVIEASGTDAIALKIVAAATSTVNSIEIWRGDTLQFKLTAAGDLYVYGTVYAQSISTTL